MRWAGHVARIGRGELYTGFCGGSPRLDGRIILRWIFQKWNGGMDWTDLTQYGDSDGHFKFGNEPSGSVKCGEFLD